MQLLNINKLIYLKFKKLKTPHFDPIKTLGIGWSFEKQISAPIWCPRY